jgi:hypothetical protein
MSTYRDAMLALDMAHNSTSSEDPWPDHDDFDDETTYNQTRRPLLTFHAANEPDTIPIHKLCPNDGWIVTPDEIRAALAAWDARAAGASTPALDEHTRDTIGGEYWSEWIAWLRLATDHDGFEVW